MRLVCFVKKRENELEKRVFITRSTLSQKSCYHISRTSKLWPSNGFSIQLQNKPTSKNEKQRKKKANENNKAAKNNEPVFIFIKKNNNCTLITRHKSKG